jgi:hypothetical protein
MRKTSLAKDVDGRDVRKGDTVATINGNLTAKVCDICIETDQTVFVCLRATHQPFSKGIWHAADQVQRIGIARR